MLSCWSKNCSPQWPANLTPDFVYGWRLLRIYTSKKPKMLIIVQCIVKTKEVASLSSWQSIIGTANVWKFHVTHFLVQPIQDSSESSRGTEEIEELGLRLWIQFEANLIELSSKCYTCPSLVAQTIKNPPAVWETLVRSPGWENPLEESMAAHSRILAWRIPMDRGAWRATFYGFTRSWTWLND